MYDWHVNDDPNRKLHGFFHPSVALENALKDYELSKKEQDIIKHHMFPLTIIPPMCRKHGLFVWQTKYVPKTLLRSSKWKYIFYVMDRLFGINQDYFREAET
ncbi:MAG: hypothetical protein ACLT2Z_02850 [Eubacterium sp.]